MKALNKKTTEILNVLTEGLNYENSHRKIDNSNGVYMPVVVEYLYDSNGGQIFSIAHYGLLNGDAMRDPDVCYLKRNGEYIPISFRNDYAGIDHEYCRYDDNGKIIAMATRWIKDCMDFTNTWMKNIKEQQNLDIKIAA